MNDSSHHSGNKEARLHLRVSIGDEIGFGAGKIELLRKLDEGQSISSAARALGMSYKRAWALVDTLNRGFAHPIVETSTGGKGGGGTHLTPLGKELVKRYEALEVAVNTAARKELAALAELAD